MCKNPKYPMCPGCGEPMRPIVHASQTGKALANMICDCGWLSPTAEGNSSQEALGAAFQLALPRYEFGLNAPVCNKPKRVTHEASKRKDCTCPSCKNVVSEWTMFRGEVFCIQTEFCKFCGQALDWSGESRYNDPQMCACYSTNGSGEPICMGTKELDSCKGPTCERWRRRGK